MSSKKIIWKAVAKQIAREKNSPEDRLEDNSSPNEEKKIIIKRPQLTEETQKTEEPQETKETVKKTEEKNPNYTITSNDNLTNPRFSGLNFETADFSKQNLRYANFTGANLTSANFSGADLTGAIFDGAILKDANFTGAILNDASFHNTEIQGTILKDIEINDVGLENLQSLLEYLAKYYPHKVNLNLINLSLIDLTRIDLSKLNLRGVDFTGASFKGVNIIGLDLSQCIITPEQIAEALGRVPNLEELHRILAPKIREKSKARNNINMKDLFIDDGKEFGVWESQSDGVRISKLIEVGKQIFRKPVSIPTERQDILIENRKLKQQEREEENKKNVRRLIEERKEQILREQLAKEKETIKENNKNITIEKPRGENER